MDKQVFVNACKKYCDGVRSLRRFSEKQTEMKTKVDFKMHYNRGVENIITFFNIHNPEKLRAKNLNDVLDYLYNLRRL